MGKTNQAGWVGLSVNKWYGYFAALSSTLKQNSPRWTLFASLLASKRKSRSPPPEKSCEWKWRSRQVRTSQAAGS